MHDRVAAFDVDGCLIDDIDQPRLEVIELLLAFRRLDYDIWVWSGGGLEYAARWVERLGLSPYVQKVLAKSISLKPAIDVAVDDQPDADLGIVTVVV